MAKTMASVRNAVAAMVVTMTSPGDTSIEYGGYGNSYGNNGDSYGNYDIYIDYDSFGYDDGNQRELRQ